MKPWEAPKEENPYMGLIQNQDNPYIKLIPRQRGGKVSPGMVFEYPESSKLVPNILEKIKPYLPPIPIPVPPNPKETREAWGQVISEPQAGETRLPFMPKVNISALGKALYGTAGVLTSQPGTEFVQPIPGLFAGPKATGFAKAGSKFSNMADKMSRFEINDEFAKFIPTKNLKETGYTATYLNEVLDHPMLYKQYPELKNHFVKIEIDPNMKAGTGEFRKALNRSGEGLTNLESEIKINAPNLKEAKETLFHEIQHYVQEKEGFAKGGNPENVNLEAATIIRKEKEMAEKRLNEILEKKDKYVGKEFKEGKVSLEETTKLAEEFWRKNPILHEEFTNVWNTTYGPNITPQARYEAYKRLAGEIEARDAASRMGLTSEQRLKMPPYGSENIPLKDWIVRKP